MFEYKTRPTVVEGNHKNYIFIDLTINLYTKIYYYI